MDKLNARTWQEYIEAPDQTLAEMMDAFERAVIELTMDMAGQNKNAAAKKLGISRATLIAKMKKHSLIDDQ